jgi:hypothetical protein
MVVAARAETSVALRHCYGQCFLHMLGFVETSTCRDVLVELEVHWYGGPIYEGPGGGDHMDPRRFFSVSVADAQAQENQRRTSANTNLDGSKTDRNNFTFLLGFTVKPCH